jgi:hypothetical protein
MRAYAVRPAQLKPFCLLDRAETVRILRAYNKLGFTSRQTASPDIISVQDVEDED